MSNYLNEMFNIAERYNVALALKNKRQVSDAVEKIHSEMAPIFINLTFENGYSETLYNLSMELLHDIRFGRRTRVDKKLIELKLINC
ncbi:hypothetical protein V5031_06665 [Enterobacter kobei]|uniref:hypothetical protein n=1 Tax=Enterobacter kobei TaxID=208224 RepID=UPI0018A3AF91|nr:hypothetical protein [Enterobacter kobei]MCK7124706.1 hypothetical protein [Enterobacter kobei]MCW4704502.1 hypothetical protein [Enterobacter kobei]UZQ67192.1 hypothetical protein OQE50_20240 [Enterobacter kobei]BBV72740.1 hypothetical protein STW0522ENT51_37420 [Enterobacter kobei]